MYALFHTTIKWGKKTLQVTLPALALALTIGSSAMAGTPTPEQAAAEKTRFLLPSPHEATNIPGEFAITANTAVVVNGRTDEAEMQVASSIAQAFGKPGKALRIRKSGDSRGKGSVIVLQKVRSWDAVQSRDLGPEGYILEVRPNSVKVIALSDHGLFYASQTLLQLAKNNRVPAIRIVDWPDVPSRMVLYDVRGLTVSVSYWKHWIDQLSMLKVNALMPFLEDDYKYQAYPYLGRPGTFTSAKAHALVALAAGRFIDLIPQLESFGHADSVLAHGELKDLRLHGSIGVYSPCTEETYKFLDGAHQELMEAFPQSSMFHVGGDEVGGWGDHQWNLSGESGCKAVIGAVGEQGLFAQHMNRLDQMVESNGRHMAMWGDEILAHPELAKLLNHDIAIFDWHYEDTKDFPSLKEFKDWGFNTIYASPAVHGFNDLYPMVPISFGNIPAFTRAAVDEKIAGVAVTIWGMIEGGNPENYLYGASYAAQVMWSHDATDIGDFDRRFAAAWFGITEDDAALHVDRLFWFPWRVSGPAAWDRKDIEGYWQNFFESTHVLFRPFDEFAMEHSIEDMSKRIEQSKALLHNIAVARESLAWLQQHANKNQQTLESMALVLADYEHMARKTIAVYQFAIDYRKAYAEDAHDSISLSAILKRGISDLKELKATFPELRQRYEQAIAHRDGDPLDASRLQVVEASLDKYIAMLELAQTKIERDDVTWPPGLNLEKSPY
jgi:hypothetical protein